MTENQDKESENTIETIELGLTVGCVIRDARKKSRKLHKTISEDLKISVKYLEGIENDNYEGFPGDAYIMGFVKNYANYLGLDGEEISKQLIKEQFSNKKQHVFNKMGQNANSIPISKSENDINKYYNDDGETNNLWLFVLAGIVLIIVIAFSIINKSEKNIVKAPSVEIDASTNLSVSEKTDNKSSILDENFIKNEDLIEFSAPVESEEIIEENINSEEQEVIEYVPQVYGIEYMDDSDLTIEFLETANLEVFDKDSKEHLFIGEFNKGDQIIVPDEDDLVMKTDNAGAVFFIVLDEKMKPLGKMGEPSEYILLDLDDLKEGKFKSYDINKKKRSWFN